MEHQRANGPGRRRCVRGLVQSTIVRTNDEIDEWLAPHLASLVNVGVDAPLIVVNETGMRPAEKLVGVVRQVRRKLPREQLGQVVPEPTTGHHPRTAPRLER